MSDYKCPHCEYYMWEGKEFYECELEQENKMMKFKLDTVEADYEASEQDTGELKAENERLKAEFRIESLTDKTTEETIYRSSLVNKYHTTLQEIKAIAEFHITDADSEDVQNDMKQILDLITKAEEE